MATSNGKQVAGPGSDFFSRFSSILGQVGGIVEQVSPIWTGAVKRDTQPTSNPTYLAPPPPNAATSNRDYTPLIIGGVAIAAVLLLLK